MGVRRTGERTKGMKDAGTMTGKGRRLTSRDERKDGTEAAGGNRSSDPPLQQGTVEHGQEYYMLTRPSEKGRKKRRNLQSCSYAIKW